MPRRTQKDAERTREKILASALTLFAGKGYEKTTFEDIARRLRMTKGAVYWHFASKDALLGEIIRGMVERFSREMMRQNYSPDKISYAEIRDVMIDQAVRIVSKPADARFFLLLKSQVHWSDASMVKVREQLMTDKTYSPMKAFRAAIENEQKAGRVRQAVDTVMTSEILMSVWDGFVQANLEHFSRVDMKVALRAAFDAVWQSIAVK